jgi:hypothetical protein
MENEDWELAVRAALKASAIRYYEKMGILDAPHRMAGQRHNPSDALDRVLLSGGVTSVFWKASFHPFGSRRALVCLAAWL